MNYINNFYIGGSTYLCAPVQSKSSCLCLYNTSTSFVNIGNISSVDTSNNVLFTQNLSYIVNNTEVSTSITFKDNIVICKDAVVAPSASITGNNITAVADVQNNIVITGDSTGSVAFGGYAPAYNISSIYISSTHDNLIIGKTTGAIPYGTRSCTFIGGGGTVSAIQSKVFLGGGVYDSLTSNGKYFIGGGDGFSQHCIWSSIISIAASGSVPLCTIGIPYPSDHAYSGFYSAPFAYLSLEYTVDNSEGCGKNFIAFCPYFCNTINRYADPRYSITNLYEIYMDFWNYHGMPIPGPEPDTYLSCYMGINYDGPNDNGELCFGVYIPSYSKPDPDNYSMYEAPTGPISVYLCQLDSISHNYTVKIEQFLLRSTNV